MKITLAAIASGAAVLLLLALAWSPLYSFMLDGGPAATVSTFGGFPLFGFPGVYPLLGIAVAVVFAVIAFNRDDDERRNALLCALGPAVFVLLTLHRPESVPAEIALRVVAVVTWFVGLVGGAVLFLSPMLAPFFEAPPKAKRPPESGLPEGRAYDAPPTAPKPAPAVKAPAQALPKPQAKPAARLTAKPETKALPSPTKRLH